MSKHHPATSWAFGIQHTLEQFVERGHGRDVHRWPLLRGFDAELLTWNTFVVVIMRAKISGLPVMGRVTPLEDEALPVPDPDTAEEWQARVRQRLTLRSQDLVMVLPATPIPSLSKAFESWSPAERRLWQCQLELNIAHHARHLAELDAQEENRRRAGRAQSLERLRSEFALIEALEDRQAAGLALERLLTALFDVFGLEPQDGFRVVGEQIDGSFVMDHEVYLLEAKFTKSKIPEKDLLVFRGKIEGKSAFTRGLFLSINGFSKEAIQAITKGKQPNFVMMDGEDLRPVLAGRYPLDEVLRRKMRWLAQRGDPFIPVAAFGP